MNNLIRTIAGGIFLIWMVLSFGGCSLAPAPPSPGYGGRCPDFPDMSNSALIRDRLIRQYNSWQGVGYRTGGLNRQGIDCSGFVALTYRSQFCIDLPRNTDLLAAVGTEVDRKELRPGDLVFFKTGFLTRHVGIYLDEGMFIHASSSKGVTLSSLTDQYWGPRFWKAKRL